MIPLGIIYECQSFYARPVRINFAVNQFMPETVKIFWDIS